MRRSSISGGRGAACLCRRYIMQMNIFLRQCVLRDSLPFAVEVPKYKPEVLAAMKEAKRISRDSETKKYSSFSEALEDLEV